MKYHILLRYLSSSGPLLIGCMFGCCWLPLDVFERFFNILPSVVNLFDHFGNVFEVAIYKEYDNIVLSGGISPIKSLYKLLNEGWLKMYFIQDKQNEFFCICCLGKITLSHPDPTYALPIVTPPSMASFHVPFVPLYLVTELSPRYHHQLTHSRIHPDTNRAITTQGLRGFILPPPL